MKLAKDRSTKGIMFSNKHLFLIIIFMEQEKLDNNINAIHNVIQQIEKSPYINNKTKYVS